MKINPIAGNWEVYRPTNTYSAETVKKAESKRDTFTLSNEAQDFGAVLRALSNVSDIREDKVGAIKQKIAEGTYNIKPEDIADKIVSNAFAARV